MGSHILQPLTTEEFTFIKNHCRLNKPSFFANRLNRQLWFIEDVIEEIMANDDPDHEKNMMYYSDPQWNPEDCIYPECELINILPVIKPKGINHIMGTNAQLILEKHKITI